MRFKAGIHNATAFHKFAASLASLGNVAWIRLNDNDVRFVIIPETGTQVWAQLAIDTVFETYTIQSANPNNAINLEVPLQPLLRALKSASNATSATLRLTKKDNVPWLVMTIVTTSFSTTSAPSHGYPDDFINDGLNNNNNNYDNPFGGEGDQYNRPDQYMPNASAANLTTTHRERETHIALDIPVVVLAPTQVSGLHEPRCREPDVHIYLPPLGQLKSVCDRFARLASSSVSSINNGSAGNEGGRRGKGPRLDIAATMHGHLRLGHTSDSLRISSTWRGLENPELDASQIEGGEASLLEHPSTVMRRTRVDEEDDEGAGWAKVRVDARDWSRVLSVGRVGGRVIACFCADHALILYCYMPGTDDGVAGGAGDESVLTYYISSIAR